jgi:hypothetical protein
MIQIFINEVELDLPANIGEQIAINFEAFPLGEFRNTFNNFSGNLTFPATAKNRLVFGHATNNLAPLTVTREYTGQILSGAIELFYGRVDYERFNNGFECRFVTSGQLLSEAIKQYDIFEVLLGLPRADAVSGEEWFDHQYITSYIFNGVGVNADGGINVKYPLLDLGYFNNTDKKIGYFDLRATFSLWTLCLAIAKKVNKALTFNGTLPDRLFNTFITPKDWKYSDRIIEVNALKMSASGVTQSFTNLISTQDNYVNFNLTNTQLGEFTVTKTTASGRDTYNLRSEFNFYLKKRFKYLVTLRTKDIIDGTFIERNGLELFWFDSDLMFSQSIAPTVTLLPNWVCGATASVPAGVEPDVRYFAGAENIVVQGFANQVGYGYEGTSDIFIQFIVSYDTELIYTANATQLIEDKLVAMNLLAPIVNGTTRWDLDVTISALPNEDVVNIAHDERIYANGLISGTDLMGTLKPADVLKYAMRLTGSYLVETDTTITLVPFGDYEKADAIDWSGKVNFVQQSIVDYRDNELGKDNWLVYQQDDTNTALDPYYLGGNLPTNLGTSIVTLYEAPFAQSAFNQTFQGALSLVRVPYYDAPLAYFYRVWINDATAYTVGQFVGYESRLFKVLANCLGSDGSPIVNTADYEEVDYSVFNSQSPEYRAIEVLEGQVTGVNIYNNGFNAGEAQVTASLIGIDFQQAITDGYGFIPSTFLDYRQLVLQVSLSDLDIHNLDLKKLVFISELNAYFYINKVEEYTPDTNVDTTVTLTMLP